MASGGITPQLHWFTDPWKEMQVDLERASDRATMYALRATGRALAKGAKAKAPVYKGDDPRAQAESGNLRRSIKSSRRLEKVTVGTYSMKVMPTGNKNKGTGVRRTIGPGVRGKPINSVRGVPLYRRKIEERVGYMRAGMAVAEADALRVFEEAYKVAFEKYRP